MAEISARITYVDSRRQYGFYKRGAGAKLNVERISRPGDGLRYHLSTYPRGAKPAPDQNGLRIELDEEAARNMLLDLLSVMLASGHGK